MRKPQSQPALAALTEADREQLADWLRRDTYEAVLDRVNKPRPEGLGLSISKKPLQTFYAKVALLDLINSRLPDDKKLTLATFESLSQGEVLLAAADPSKITAAHDAILQTTSDLAKSGDNTPTQLLALQRLADFPARAEIRAQRAELDQQKFAHKLEMDAFRKQIAAARLELAERSFAFRQKKTRGPPSPPHRQTFFSLSHPRGEGRGERSLRQPKTRRPPRPLRQHPR